MIDVLMITYNHEKFIGQAIEGILSQKTSFPKRLIIANDASTDKTQEIIESYVSKFPNDIIRIHNQNNLGAQLNFINVYKYINAKYTALCEGDDYWTDPLKLQKQVDFLENNSDFAICFHRVEVIYEDMSQSSYISNQNQNSITNFTDLAKFNYIHTLSCVFRSKLFQQFPDFFPTSPIGDYPLHLLNAQYGKIKFLKDIMGVYRIHGSGVWGNINNIRRAKDTIETIINCRNLFHPLGCKEFNIQICKLLGTLCNEYFEVRDFRSFRKYYLDYLYCLKFSNPIEFIYHTKRFLYSLIYSVSKAF